MIDLLIIIFLNAVCIIGFNKATEEGMILNWLADKAEDILPTWINKPLWACPYCMSSIHSTYIAIPYFISIGLSFWFYPVYIIALCGMVCLTYNAYEILRRYN